MKPAGSPFPLGRTARLAVFASGRGSNLQALMEAFPTGHPLGEVVLVVSDHATAPALEKARRHGVEAVHVNWRKRSEFEREARELLEARGIDLICLAGFMRLLSADFVELLEGRIVNIHPSLLPEFPGLNPQLRALKAGRTEAGCSVHFVDAGVDTGPVILQRAVPIHPGDDEASLTARILEQEHLAYPEAVRLVLRGEAKS